MTSFVCLLVLNLCKGKSFSANKQLYDGKNAEFISYLYSSSLFVLPSHNKKPHAIAA